jgi:predicted transcriptional regulator
MARAGLNIGVRELANLAKVSPTTISKLEAGDILRERTVEDILRALEQAGVVFIDANGHGPGVRLKKG